jgi:hypothetical protein
VRNGPRRLLVALFLLGTAGSRASMPLPRPFGRVAFAAAVLGLAPLGLVNAGLQLGAIAIVLVAGLAIEHRAQATTGARALGMTSGVPVSGSSMMRHGRSKTRCTISAVTISAGAPSATIAPSRIAMRCVA